MFAILYAGEAFGANYYASPGGGGNGSSVSSPFKISNFWSVAKAGDILYLLDGTYTGSNSMISPPDGLSGPITIKALHDGEVLINGQDINQPVVLHDNDYFVLEGINACCAKESELNSCVIEVDHDSSTLNRSENVTIRRVIAWDANPYGNDMPICIHRASDTLLEDVAAWGTGRKSIGLYKDIRTTIRRAFGMWSGHSTAGGTYRLGMTLYYGSTDTRIENSISTWDRRYGEPSGEDTAIYGGDGGGLIGTARFYGNIGYFKSGQQGPFGSIYNVNGYQVDIKDSLMFSEEASKNTFYMSSSTVCNYCTSIGGTGFISGKVSNSIKNPSINNLGGDVLQYRQEGRPSTGAWIKYRYVNGQLTNEPLWPWPMNERIKQAMVDSGYDSKGGLDGKGGTDITKTIFTLGGGTMPSFDQSNTSDSTPPAAPISLMIQ